MQKTSAGSDNRLGQILKELRTKENLGLRELCRVIERHTSSGRSISPAYYSQVENASNINLDKVSIDFFWAVGAALKIDPLVLFVASRPEISDNFLDAKKRDRIFKIRSYPITSDNEKPASKKPWPKSLPEQISSVHSLLEEKKCPVATNEVKQAFNNAPAKKVHEILTSLVSIGKARETEKGEFLSVA